ncbi:hypothetical protein BCE02nite_20840 [Brevibacillus centrosporus]|nr:hypothetical protein BCE02nite_20840 [Brevibacillus centrosporus]
MATTSKTYPESTSRSQTQTLTIPNLKSVSSVTAWQSGSTWYHSYLGTVTKPSTDTRTYAYYYQYTVIVNYEDNRLPSIALTSPADNLSLGRRTIDSVPVNLSGEVQEMPNADSA